MGNPMRTRWLNILDNLVMTDRQGAIDDMLQVLREHGVIQDAHATVELPDQFSEDEVYRDSARRQIANMLGAFLMKEGIINFITRPTHSPYHKAVAGTVTIVKETKNG